MSMPGGAKTAIVCIAGILIVFIPSMYYSGKRMEKEAPLWRNVGVRCSVKHTFLECERYCRAQGGDYSGIHNCIEGAMNP